MITMSGWTVNVPFEDRKVGYSGENKVSFIEIALLDGDYSEFTTYTLEIAASVAYSNILELTKSGNSLKVEILESFGLPDGTIKCQVVGVNEDGAKKKSNTFTLQVIRSINASSKYPPALPSEFSQMEQRIYELNQHPPFPGDSGFWMIWNPDTDQYEQSELPLPEGGVSGATGGYYTPSVEQTDETTMQVSFSPSKDDMGAVEPVNVTLPRGRDGADGSPGKDGEPGKDGVSPTASVQQTETGATITVTDSTGTTTATVQNGRDGDPGADGKDGEPGADGFSPTVSTEAISEGTRVTITDSTGQKSFDVMNGKNGADGAEGPAGADGKTPVKGVDYYTEADKEEMVQAVIAALPVYNGEVQDG